MGRVRKRGSKLRVCLDCGKSEQVRQDNHGLRCRACAPKAAARTNMASGAYSRLRPPTKKARPEGRVTLTCGGCSGLFTRFASGVAKSGVSYCSPACFSASKSVTRVCKHCCGSFVTQVGRLSGKTNSSANFCSRDCYWASMRKPVKAGKLAGGIWQRLSESVRVQTPFCGCCGKVRGRLETHHILPRRLGGSDDRSNLIPLCPSCHKRVESLTRAMARDGLSAETIRFYMTARLRFRQFHTFHILRKVANERARSLA